MEIEIQDVFYLDSIGRVAFAIESYGAADEIRAGWFELWIDGKNIGRIWVDGEDFLSPRNEVYRSISTRHTDVVKRHSFTKGHWKLVAENPKF